MPKGKDWGELEFNKDDKSYEADLSNWTLLENRTDEDEFDGKKGKQKAGWDNYLTTKIQEQIEDLKMMWGSRTELTFDMGLKLLELSGLLSGNFKRTVNECMPFSYSTAISYMNVAEKFDSAEEAALFDSKVMYAMTTSQFPAQVRDEMIFRAKEGEVITIDEVREARDKEKKRRETASEIDDNSEVIEFEKSPCTEMMEHIKESLKGIISEVENIPWPDELSITEESHKIAIWTLLEKLADVFEPED